MSEASRSEETAPQEPGTGPKAEVGPRGTVAEKVRSIEAAAISGIGFSILGVIALQLLASFPDLDQTDAELNAWFADSSNQTTLIIGANLMALSSILFLWFVAVIRRRLGTLEDRFFGTVFLGSAFAFVGVWLGHGAALAGPAAAVSHIDGATVDVSSATNAAGIGGAFLLLIGPRLQAVFVIVTSTLIMRSRVLPTWLAVVGFVVAFAMLFVPLLFDTLGLGFPAWVLLVSVVILLVRPRTRAAKLDTGS